MRVLITGATGFVGGHLTERLLQAGDVIVGLSTSGSWPRQLQHLIPLARVESLNIATAGPSICAELIARKQPEVVYHLAAQPNPQASVDFPIETWNVNLGGTLNLLEGIRHSGLRPRIVLIGSGVSYGNPTTDFIPVDENCPLKPNNPYAASKAAADLLAIQHVLAHNADIVIARPFNHAGPRQSEKYVLGGLARQVAEVERGLKQFVVVGNLDIVRDFTDVRDIVEGYYLLAKLGKSGEVYNIGQGIGTRLQDALNFLISQATRPIEVRVDPARFRAVDSSYLIANPAKFRGTTRWKPNFTIEHTLKDMLDEQRRLVMEQAAIF